MKGKKILVVVAVLSLFCAGCFQSRAWAAESLGGGSVPEGLAGFGNLLDEIQLSGPQRQEAAAIFRQHFEQAQPVRERIRETRRALIEAVTSETFSEEAIREAHAKLALEQEEMWVLRGLAYREILSILTPEQKDKATQWAKAARLELQNRAGFFRGLVRTWIENRISSDQ